MLRRTEPLGIPRPFRFRDGSATMPRFAKPLAALCVVLLPALSRAGSIPLDPLTTPFLQSDCQAEAGRWVLFTGRFCMGTCPPDTFVSAEACGMGIVVNPDLRLPISPDREVWRSFQIGADLGPDDDSSVEMLPAEGAFDVRDRSPGEWWFMASWQSPAWDLDLAALGVTALRLPLAGEVDEARPLFITALIRWDDGFSHEVRMDARAVTTGDLVLPFAGSAPSHVHDILLLFTDCAPSNDFMCHPLPMFGPRRYRIGAPSFETNAATALKRRSWGALKTRAY